MIEKSRSETVRRNIVATNEEGGEGNAIQETPEEQQSLGLRRFSSNQSFHQTPKKPGAGEICH